MIDQFKHGTHYSYSWMIMKKLIYGYYDVYLYLFIFLIKNITRVGLYTKHDTKTMKCGWILSKF